MFPVLLFALGGAYLLSHKDESAAPPPPNPAEHGVGPYVVLVAKSGRTDLPAIGSVLPKTGAFPDWADMAATLKANPTSPFPSYPDAANALAIQHAANLQAVLANAAGLVLAKV